jgi:hypothetical protein
MTTNNKKDYSGAKAAGCMGMAIVLQLIVSIIILAAIVATIKWIF